MSSEKFEINRPECQTECEEKCRGISELSEKSSVASAQSPFVITMSFDMTDEYGREAFIDCKDGRNAGYALWMIGSLLQTLDKYGVPSKHIEGKSPVEASESVVEMIKEQYYETLNAYDVRRHGY